MKCALEMLKIQQETRQAWELEQREKDEECRREHLHIIQNTVEFCETYIQEHLEKVARRVTNEPTEIAIAIKVREKSDRLNHNLFSMIYRDGQIYSNGTISHSVAEEIYDLDIFTKFLEEHCYTVEKFDDGFYHYGSGYQNGQRIEISVKL